jgi:uncharacterized protein YlbG (UPF0298 family)
MTLDELIHYVNLNLTFSGALPQYLNNQQIENIIENIAKPYFHRDVFESKIKEYIYIPKNAFMKNTHNTNMLNYHVQHKLLYGYIK